MNRSWYSQDERRHQGVSLPERCSKNAVCDRSSSMAETFWTKGQSDENWSRISLFVPTGNGMIDNKTVGFESMQNRGRHLELVM